MQFQSFSQFRAKLEGKSEEEMTLLRGNPQIWNVHIVLNVLHSLIDKSRINEQLAEYRKGDNPQEVAGEFGSRTLYKMLGYFSLVGLLRLHVLLGRCQNSPNTAWTLPSPGPETPPDQFWSPFLPSLFCSSRRPALLAVPSIPLLCIVQSNVVISRKRGYDRC